MISRSLPVVTSRALETRQLITIGTNDPLWNLSGDVHDKAFDSKNVEGAIVRLRPPAQVTTEQIRALRKKLLRAGAVAVKDEPRAPGEAVVVHGEAPPEDKSIRETIETMVAEANSSNRQALSGLLQELMDIAGV